MKDKIILITGASNGIGRACAEEFAKHGAKLILLARRLDRLTELAAVLKKSFNTATYVAQCDVTQLAEVQQVLNQLPTEWQAIDVLINNAGLSLGLESIATGNTQDWDQMIDTNIKGLLYVTRTVTPGMLQRNHGHVINIGSISGHQVYPGGTVYCSTKYAVNAITQGLKLDFHGTKLRVSTVDPGITETEFSTVRFKGDQTKASAVYQNANPLLPSDIADAVYYCASRPAHVNVSEIIVLPTSQSSATLIKRGH